MKTIGNLNINGLEGEARLRHAEKEGIKISKENLMTFPWIKDRVYAGDLTLHGLLFDLEKGELSRLTSENEWEQV